MNRIEEAAGVLHDVVERYAGDSAPGVQAVVERARREADQIPGVAPD